MQRSGKIKGDYQKRYKYDVCCNDPGVPGPCMDWCESNCTGPWGWWFETTDEWVRHWDYKNNVAYVSFSKKTDATRFWFENIRTLEEQKNLDN